MRAEKKIKLKNYLIVVDKIEKAKQFYYDLFGIEFINGNMILSEGLVLQQKSYWKDFLGKEIVQEK